MALNIENTSGVPLEIEDFSITLANSEIIDLSLRIDPLEVAQSAISGNELSTLITAGDVSVKDPIDGTTALSVADGLAACRATNETHWRVGTGARIGDLSDVDDTGVVTDDVLQFNGTDFVVVAPETVGGGASFQLEWRFSTSTTASDPGNANFRYNNVTLASVTAIYFDDNATGGFDVGTIFNTLASGDKIYIQQNTDATKAALFTLSGSPTDNTGWWTIPVTVDASGTLHDNNAKCATLFFQSGAGGGVSADMDSAQARRTTNFTLTASFGDITLDATDVENNTAVVEHDNTNTERLTLKSDGLYMIYYGMSMFPSSGSSEAHTEVASRVQANGAGGAVPGSSDRIEQIIDGSITGDLSLETNMVRTFLYEATANDFVTLQAQTQNTTGTIVVAAQNVVFGAVKMTGQQGPSGSDQNLFETFTPDSGGNIVADTTTDTLTLAGGSAITTSGTPASDTITISVSNNPTFPGIESITISIGTTAERPVSPVNGMMRYNTDTNKFEVYENGSWRNMGTGGSGNFELYDENPVSPTPPNASGDNSVAIGDGATASGLDAIAYGAQADASGGDSIAFGMNAVSSNTNSVALGSDTIASGSNSMALGEGATSTATDSYSFGRDVLASAIGSMALLEDADSRLEGGIAQAAGQFSSKGDAQSTVLVSRNSTTDATVTELFQNGTSARLVLANDSTWAFKILVVARRTDANDESAMYQFLGGIDRNATAATTAIVGNVSKTVIAEDTAQWNCDVDADTTNGSLRIQVTGQAAKTIRWVARVELVEVTG